MLDKLRRDTDPESHAGPSRPLASSSTADPVLPAEPPESSAPENPVVAAAQKVNSVIRKQVAGSSRRHRPSVRIRREPSSSSIPVASRPFPEHGLHDIPEHGLHDIPEETATNGRRPPEPRRSRWLSIFFHSGAQAPASNAAGDDAIPAGAQEPRRKRLMVPAAVADKIAPHMAPHAQLHGDSQALADHMAAHADAHRPPSVEENNGLLRQLSGRAEAAVRWISNHANPSDYHGSSHGSVNGEEDEYTSEMVDLLDVVDPEVSTLSTLTNVQNSLFIPSLGRFLNRQPTYQRSSRPVQPNIIEKLKTPLRVPTPVQDEKEDEFVPGSARPSLTHSSTISSTLSESRYAVLPHGASLAGWTPEEKEMLNDLVRHMLHSRRARFKRAMKGFGQYVRRPLGLFVTVYATLITIFGAAWVLFLIGWISLGSKRDYVIDIVDNVLVALFAIIGDGLAPFRAVDTYHMIYIAHYYHKTWSQRKKLGLPELEDHNDLPDQRKEDIALDADVESLAGRRVSRVSTFDPEGSSTREYSVLTKEQQGRLEFHVRKFSKSHTFYKPHETATHYAFPLRLLIAIVVLLDFHSMLQISLGACTWGIPYKTRPFALTTVILCCSITCNIMGGVLISVGDHRTRKKDVLERMMRQELTAEAKEQIEKQKMKEMEDRGVLDASARKKVEEAKEEAENEEIKKEWKKVPLLPKKLLGKAEDSREPSLPQKSRRSLNNSRSRTSTDLARKSESASSIPAIPSPTQPPSQQGTRNWTNIMRKPVANSPSSSATASASSAPPPPPRDAPGGPSGPAASQLRGQEVQEGKRDKIMKFIRRADLDRS